MGDRGRQIWGRGGGGELGLVRVSQECTMLLLWREGRGADKEQE